MPVGASIGGALGGTVGGTGACVGAEGAQATTRKTVQARSAMDTVDMRCGVPWEPIFVPFLRDGNGRKEEQRLWRGEKG